jgi:hypothetical protein
MYTFQPLATIPASHEGFGIIVALCLLFTVVVLMNEPDVFFQWFFVATITCGIAYFVSYSWTDQTPKTFVNEKVTATFVGFEAEGYKEKSGKSFVDKHFTYVVYNVNGSNVLLSATTGQTYPQTVILYKN